MLGRESIARQPIRDRCRCPVRSISTRRDSYGRHASGAGDQNIATKTLAQALEFIAQLDHAVPGTTGVNADDHSKQNREGKRICETHHLSRSASRRNMLG